MKPSETGLDYVDRVRAVDTEIKTRAGELDHVRDNLSTRLGEVGWVGTLVLAALLKDTDGSIHPVFLDINSSGPGSQDFYVAAGTGFGQVMKAEGLGGGKFAVDWGKPGQEEVEYDLLAGGSINAKGELVGAGGATIKQSGILVADIDQTAKLTNTEERLRALIGGRTSGETYNSFKGIIAGMDKASGGVIPQAAEAKLPSPDKVLS